MKKILVCLIIAVLILLFSVLLITTLRSQPESDKLFNTLQAANQRRNVHKIKIAKIVEFDSLQSKGIIRTISKLSDEDIVDKKEFLKSVASELGKLKLKDGRLWNQTFVSIRNDKNHAYDEKHVDEEFEKLTSFIADYEKSNGIIIADLIVSKKSEEQDKFLNELIEFHRREQPNYESYNINPERTYSNEHASVEVNDLPEENEPEFEKINKKLSKTHRRPAGNSWEGLGQEIPCH